MLDRGRVMARALTRRDVIGAAAATLVLAALKPTSVEAASADTFALDPSGGAGCTTNCSSCRACQLHAANKLFHTEAAADIGRAHIGCDCTVAVGQSLSQGTIDLLFQSAEVADRRFAATATLLAAETNQHAVPMITGVVPMALLAGGAAGVVLLRSRRRAITVAPEGMAPQQAPGER